MADQIRYALIVRTCMEVLRDYGGVVPRKQLAAEVEERIRPNAAEQAIQSNGETAWITAMGFHTGDAATAGWLTKGRDGWQLTAAGRAALTTLPTAEALLASI